MAGEGMGGYWGLIIIYYVIKLRWVLVVTVPLALVGLGYYLGAS